MRLFVHQRRVLLEDVVALLAGGVLELLHRARIEEVRLAVATPLVLAVIADAHPFAGCRAVSAGVQGERGPSDVFERDAPHARGEAGKVARQHLGVDADGLEELAADVARDGGDAHLGHHLDDALGQRLGVLVSRLGRGLAGDLAVGDERVDALVGQVRTHRGGAEAEQQRHVMHFAHIAGLHDECRTRAQVLLDQSVVHRRRQQQTGYGGQFARGVAVREDDDVRPGAHQGHDLVTHAVDGAHQTFGVARLTVDGEEALHHDAVEVPLGLGLVDVADLGQLVVAQDR